MTTSRAIRFTLNGRPETAAIESHRNLVELLQQFGLFGAKEGCGQGLCGCCTVVVDGKAVSGCLYLAVLVDGKDVRTVEGLDRDGRLSAVQEAFVETGAFQCGYCTPGFVQMAEQLLESNPSPTESEIRDYLSGNLCRCASYPEIIAAVKAAAGKSPAA